MHTFLLLHGEIERAGAQVLLHDRGGGGGGGGEEAQLQALTERSERWIHLIFMFCFYYSPRIVKAH